MRSPLDATDAYGVLGVAREADAAAITRAFRQLTLKHHPDLRPPTESAAAGARMARVLWAYLLLKDPEKRRRHDAMLQQGRTPNPGDCHVPALAGMLGSLPALGIETDQRSLLADMDEVFRQHLEAALIRGERVRESVIDVLTVDAIENSKGIHLPQGHWSISDAGTWASYDDLKPAIHRAMREGCSAEAAVQRAVERASLLSVAEGWLVVTELRLILLLEISQECKLPTEEIVTKTHYCIRSFPFAALASLAVQETGRASKSYDLHLADEDGTSVTLKLLMPSFTALLLAAAAHHMPVEVYTRAERGAEYLGAILKALVPVLLWALPLLAYAGWKLVSWPFTSNGPGQQFAGCGSIYQWMTSYYLTTLAIYLSPLLLALGVVRVYRAWNTRRADELIGQLPHDFALKQAGSGVPAS